jgi:hypothetical protein
VDELDALLEVAGKRGFVWHVFRANRTGPDVLAGVLQRPGCADVFVISDAECAHAYRMPSGPESDVFAPRDVFWWYGGNPVWTLRTVLTLPEPGRPEAPAMLAPPPPGSGVLGDRTPVRVRRLFPRR